MLDASGSMNDPDPSGVSKLAAAQKALSSVVDTLPDSAVVGLRVYGATVNVPSPTPQSCADSQLIAPIAPLDRAGLKAAVGSFKAVGDTPIAHALGEGVKDLGSAGKRNIVLVSDGEENCVPDPCPAVKALVAAGVDLQIDTVGFGVGDKARQQLQCIADAGRGSYYDAKDAGALTTSLGKLSERALRPFSVSGTPVRATDAPEAGPVLAPGQYTDSFATGTAKRYYRVNRTPGSTVRLSVTSRPPARGSIFDFEDMVLTVTTPGGSLCGQDTETRFDAKRQSVAVGHPGRGRGRRAHDVQQGVPRRDRARRRREPDQGGGTEVPVELLVIEEPPVADVTALPPAVDAANVAPVVAPASGAEQRVVGGGSFSDAATLAPGTYADTILPGEQVFYRVRVEFGQQLAVTADVPAPGQNVPLGNVSYIYVDLDTWAPDRAAIVRSSGEPKTNALLGPNTRSAVVGDYTAPVQYLNRAAKATSGGYSTTDLRRTALAGYYYVAVSRSRATEPDESLPFDIRLRVAVTGTAAGQPVYANAAGVSGLETTPPVTATSTESATTGTAPVTAGDESTSGPRPSSVIWAIAGVVLLFAAGILGGVLWRRRRDSADGGQPGGGQPGGGQPGGGSQA